MHAQSSQLKLAIGYTNAQLNEFLEHLHKIGANKIDTRPGKGWPLKIHEKEPWRQLSPAYFNYRIKSNKDGPLTDGDVRTIATFFLGYIIRHEIFFDGIAGAPRAGEPFAQSLAEQLEVVFGRKIPVLRLEKIECAAGRRKIGGIIGPKTLPCGSRVLLVDDLITKSGSKMEAIEAFESEGFAVQDCLVFLDREQGGKKELRKCGVFLHSIVEQTNMLSFYRSRELISAQDHRILTDYFQNDR